MPDTTPTILSISGRCYITPAGEIMPFERKQTLPEVNRLLQCSLVEVIRLRHTPELRLQDWVMLVDEEALTRPPKEQLLRGINPVASALYMLQCVPNTWHPIIGAAVIARDSDYAEDDDDQPKIIVPGASGRG